MNFKSGEKMLLPQWLGSIPQARGRDRQGSGSDMPARSPEAAYLTWIKVEVELILRC